MASYGGERVKQLRECSHVRFKSLILSCTCLLDLTFADSLARLLTFRFAKCFRRNFPSHFINDNFTDFK